MSVIKRKGKWKFGYKDTYSLDYTLSPIIYAGLSKFHEVLSKRNKEDKIIGVPSEYCANPDVDVTNQEVQNWLDDIKKMMYAFNPDSAPKIQDYGFTLNMVELEKTGEGRSYTIETTNQEESDRYDRDRKIHEEKVQEGLNLFSQRYLKLWW